MRPTSLDELSLAQAQTFCDHVIAREPVRLIELAQWMTLTGGPIELMDGSFGSLIPFWEWFVPYLRSDMPGVGPTARAGLVIAFDRPGDKTDEELRSGYAQEVVTHYVMQVVRTYAPQTKWAVLDDPGNLQNHWIGYNLDGREVIPVALLLTRFARRGMYGERNSDRPDGLAEFMVQFFRRIENQMRSSISGGPSILQPLVGLSTDGFPDLAYTPPIFTQSHRTPNDESKEDAQLEEDIWVLAGIGARTDELAHFPPLPAAAVTDQLYQLNSILNGPPLQLPVLTVDTNEFYLGNHNMQVTTMAAGGTLRAVYLQVLDLTEQQWTTIRQTLDRFGQTTRTRFAAEPDWKQD